MKKKTKIKMKPLEGYFQKIAKVFAKKDLKVLVQGNICATDGKLIVLPANIDDLEGSDRQVAEGMLDHEWSHNALGEEDKQKEGRDLFELLQNLPEKECDLKPWLNIFDDIRLVQKCQYPGALDNMEKAHKIILGKLCSKVKSGELTFEKKPIQLIGSGIIATVLDQDKSFIEAPVEEILNKLGPILDEAKRGLDTLADVERLARATKAKLDLIQKEQDQEERGEGEGSGQGEDQQGEREEGKDQSNSSQYNSSKDSGHGQTEDEGDHGPSKIEDIDNTIDPLQELAKEILTKAAQQDLRDNRRHIPDPRVLEMDKVVTAHKGNFADLRARVKAPANSLKNRLISLLKARSLSYTSLDHERGEIDSTALYSVSCGNKRIFCQTIQGETLDVAVGILIDNSGSMQNYGKYLRAREVAGVMGEALDAVKVPFFVMSWHNYYDNGWLKDQQKPYNRFVPYYFQIFKDFGEKWKLVRGRLETLFPNGDNDDGGAVRFAAKKLITQKASRYILFVLSDGDPATHCPDWASLREDLKTAVGQVMHAGIEVIGIGIQDDAVEQFYPVWLVVKDLSEFVPKVVKILKDLLTEGARKWKQMGNM